jgi:membrane protein YqaA with SNARE-associated domain
MEYLLAMGIVAGMALTPIPLPPSWLVLAYLSLELGADPVGIVLAGALGAAMGRTALAATARALGPRVMRPSLQANVDYLGARLHRPRATAGVAVLLAASPPPAGALYAAAGILRVNLALVAASCFAGRAVTYGIGVALVGSAAGEIPDRLRDAAAPWSIGLGLALVAAVLWLLVRIEWRTLLEERRLRLRARRAGAPA